MNIAVFCSANANLDPDFFAATRELGQWMGHEGHTLVYGGANLGLMESVAEATHQPAAPRWVSCPDCWSRRTTEPVSRRTHSLPDLTDRSS